MNPSAFDSLRECRRHLTSARESALSAESNLDAGARRARAHELGEKLADCIAYTERLAFIVEGDLHSTETGK
ncbi:hypothetical protein A5782_21655 [Mycobacterium sp. 852002-40037_SCH5390672]|nr:hypothetical protein A5782_21655 [Mycobacterium sp. 852002-40037_SCH5390672]